MAVMNRMAVNRILGGGPGVRVNVNWFFDRPHVASVLGKAEKKFLSKAGGQVRLTARRSIRKKGKARSAPGQGRAREQWLHEIQEQPASPAGHPPYTHTGFLRESILYALDPTDKSVVIGPSKSPWLNQLHEFGGRVTMGVWRRKTTGTRVLLKRGPKNKRAYAREGSTVAVYPPRPFMSPALDKITPKLPEMYKHAVRAST